MLNVGKSLTTDKLTRTRWAFGQSNLAPITTTFYFGSNGLIEGFSSQNEASWRFEDGNLEILARDGEVMWQVNEVYLSEDSLHIVLRSPRFPAADVSLYECTQDGYKGNAGSAGLASSEFLFPNDLNVTPTPVRKILLVGSCLTDLYHKVFIDRYPKVVFEYVLFNIASDLPKDPPSAPSEYDLQYLQLPLRSVVTDRVITGGRLNDAAFWEETFDDGCAMIDAMLDSGLAYNKAHGLLTFVANFIVPQMDISCDILGRGGSTDLAAIVRRFNAYLAEAIGRYRNVFMCNVDALAASIGKRYIMDDVTGFYTHGSIFHQDSVDLEPGARIEPVPHINSFYVSKHEEFLAAIYQQILATFRTIRQIDQVKAVIFDLDNTLWRGQIAEDYRPDLATWPSTHGAAWQIGIWEAIQHIRARGILVAICSKNDLDVVRNHWENAVRPAFLKLEDFACVKINWRPKAENVAEICGEFNIKPKSVVFVDDNPVEREAVRSAFPEIRTIGSNPYLTRRILLWAPELQIASLTQESAQREASIRGQVVREQSRAVMSREEFLRSLDCTITFLEISDAQQPEFTRVLELTNKTNQFNTTGRRWTHSEMLSFLSEGGRIVGFRVKDKFSEYGLVGALYLSGSNIGQFVMSCRVLGMEVEQAAITYVVELVRARREDNLDIFATLTETADNFPCREVFAKAGFAAAEQNGAQHLFRLDRGRTPQSPAHIRLKA